MPEFYLGSKFNELIIDMFDSDDAKHIYSTIIFIMEKINKLPEDKCIVLDNNFPGHIFFMFGHVAFKYNIRFYTFLANDFTRAPIGLF